MTLESRAEQILQKLSLQDKTSLLSGRDLWSTPALPNHNIKSVFMADGPHGLRKASTSDSTGFGDQAPATSFPTASAMAATWNTDLLFQIGRHLGIECRASETHVLLGPGINIKRSPLGGRNFEYFSEDPVISGELGAAYINGVQSEGIGVSLKHFACNNQEYCRMLMSSEVDQRTLREIYLKPFEIAVKKSAPATIMSSYNRLNGQYTNERFDLLTQILRKEWGFDGVVISDWISVNNRINSVKAGMNIEMPGTDGTNNRKVENAVINGELEISVLDALVKETLVFILKSHENFSPTTFDQNEHHLFARQVAEEAATLLKNQQGTLPVTPEKYKKVLVVGEFAEKPRIQGNGSSDVKPTRISNALDEIRQIASGSFEIEYSQGYSLSDTENTEYISQARQKAEDADVVIIFAGLPQNFESEEYDRKDIALPSVMNALISEISQVNSKSVVVLTNGAAVTMPWVDEVPAILESWLAGQAGAEATARILFGDANPSGKLPESFPMCIEDTSDFLNFPGEDRKVLYGERIFVGYRHHEIRKIAPLFAFGHGLSYTQFTYSNLTVSHDCFAHTDSITVAFQIKNTGTLTGKEVVQLYLSDEDSSVVRPLKELKRFAKIELAPNEEKTVSFELSYDDFCFYDTSVDLWRSETGTFQVLIGASSQDIRMTKSLTLSKTPAYNKYFDEFTILRDFTKEERLQPMLTDMFMPVFTAKNCSEEDIRGFKLPAYFLDMPLNKYLYFSNGLITEEKIAEILDAARNIHQSK